MYSFKSVRYYSAAESKLIFQTLYDSDDESKSKLLSGQSDPMMSSYHKAADNSPRSTVKGQMTETKVGHDQVTQQPQPHFHTRTMHVWCEKTGLLTLVSFSLNSQE